MQETWDAGSIPGWRRSPGGGNSNLLQYSGLKNPMDRETWQAILHRFSKSWTRLRRLSKHPYLSIIYLSVHLRRELPPTGHAGFHRDPRGYGLGFQFSSVTQLCLTLCNPMDCSTPGSPVHHQLLELTQIHVYWVHDAIQPSHPLLSPSSPTFNLTQNQGLFN